MRKKRSTYVAPRRWWQRRKKQLMWITDDGSWGMGDFYVVNVAGWSDADWDAFEEASDWERVYVAQEIGDK